MPLRDIIGQPMERDVMATVEQSKLSYIRAFREVEPSDSLKLLLKAATQLVEDGSFDRGEANRSDPLVYAADSLRFTLFERRVQAGHDVNELLRKVSTYVDAPYHYTQKRTRSRPSGPLVTTHARRRNPLPESLRDVEQLHVPDRRQLVARSSRVVDSTKDDFRHLGTELALMIEPGAVADVLQAQSDLLNDAAMRTNAAKKLPRTSDSDNPLRLPFMRASFANSKNLDEFVDILATELPVYDLRITPIVYRSNIVEI